jgi:hypothetical protein
MAIRKRDVAIRVMVTAQERAELKKAADKASMPLSIYMRVAALEKARSGPP